jgi:flagellar hook-basal body complex protein FliE
MSDPLGLIGNPQQGPGGAQQPQGPQGPNAPRDPQQAQNADGAGFKDVLMDEIQQVNKLQQDAQTAIEDLQTGKRDDVDAVMMAKVHADTAFKMLLQVRNKLMSAYDEVKQIRV